MERAEAFAVDEPTTIDEPIEGRVAVHDSTHFEVKLDYDIDSSRKPRGYRVESYFFVPKSLGISRHTYRPEQFYSDVHSYIRFKTPEISLSRLCEVEDTRSPLSTIMRLLRELRHHPRSKERKRTLRQEMRMFGCIARARIRDHVGELETGIAAVSVSASPASDDVRALASAGMRLIEHIDRLMTSWREIHKELVTPGKKLRETWKYVDEYLSVVVEAKTTDLIKAIDDSKLGTELAMVRDRARRALLRERSYREQAGYIAVVKNAEEVNEHYIYRRGVLKKFVMSVLWLEVSKEKEGGGAANMVAAIAAGAAMFLALVATLWQMKSYVINTWGFVFAGTFIYILKDRIKEWLRQYLSTRMSGWLADYSVKIRDPETGYELGRCRESFSYRDAGNIPKEVLDMRHEGRPKSIEAQGKPEVVLCYRKDIRLRGHELVERLHLERYDVNDIIRFGIQEFLLRADDPVAAVPTYDPNNDKVVRKAFPKVYHLNVVMVWTADVAPDKPIYHRVRVVFNKSGIERLDTVC